MLTIVLAGQAGCGKTSTLNIVYEQLQNIYECDIDDEQVSDAEFRAALSFDGHSVEVMSAGNDLAKLLAAIAEAGDSRDVFVASCDQELLGPFENVVDGEYRVVSKSLAEGAQRQLFSNIRDCESILNLIEARLG